MNINFRNKERLESVQAQWADFFHHRSDAPLLTYERVWEGDIPALAEYQRDLPYYDPAVSPEEMIRIADDFYACRHYIGVTAPVFGLSLGPAGSGAAFLGCPVNTDHDSIWFETTGQEMDEISVEGYKNNPWYKRYHTVLDAALARWDDGTVMIDVLLGNSIDWLAAMRSDQELCMDLLDEEEVLDALLPKMTASLMEMHSDIWAKVQPICSGMAATLGSLAAGPTARMQSDFCNMVSPEMYDRFVLPEMKTMSEFLVDPIYHLDGTGQLAHLDSILTLDKIRMIEWVAGAGQKPPHEWPEVFQKIQDAGKRCQVFVNAKEAIALKETIGLDGFALFIGEWLSPKDATDLHALLTK